MSQQPATRIDAHFIAAGKYHDIDHARLEVLKLLGASDGFVRRPVLYVGLWYGVIGGLVALFLMITGGWLLAAPLERPPPPMCYCNERVFVATTLIWPSRFVVA